MNLGIGSLRTGIFNVADVAILAGAALLLLPGSSPQPTAAPAPPSPSPSEAADESRPQAL